MSGSLGGDCTNIEHMSISCHSSTMLGFLAGACTDMSMISMSQTRPPAENVQTIQDDGLFQDDQMASHAGANKEHQLGTPQVQQTQLPDSASHHGKLITSSSSVIRRKRQDKPAVSTTSKKCCYQEVDFSESLRKELIEKEWTAWTQEHNDIQQQAVGAAQCKFAKQSADMQAVIWSQEAEIKALHSALQEYPSHHKFSKNVRWQIKNTEKSSMVSAIILRTLYAQRWVNLSDYLIPTLKMCCSSVNLTRHEGEQRKGTRKHGAVVFTPWSADRSSLPPGGRNLHTHAVLPPTSPGPGYALPCQCSNVTTPSLVP
ncbi:hypothetical protein EDD15DRAFT_2194898 [Pisolithus albus]|nr:hypothetical protein EDD15DRAFT_2194898 [Pisolithus albus]